MEVLVKKELDKELFSQWEKLWQKSRRAHFFNSPYWLKACLEAFNIKDYYIFICYQDREIKAILPLVPSKKYGLKVLLSPGKICLDKSTLFLAEDNVQILDSLFSEVLKNNNLYLAEVEESLKNTILESQQRSLTEMSIISPYGPILDEVFRFMSKRNKKKLAKKISSIKKDLVFRFFREDLEKNLSTIFKIEEGSYKKTKDKAIFGEKAYRDLYLNIAKYAPNNIALAILFLKEKPISYKVGLLWQKTFMAFNTAYLEEYRRLVPGKILLCYLMPRLKKEGFETFDFSRGKDQHKMQVVPLEKKQFNIYFTKNVYSRMYWQVLLFVKNKIIVGRLRAFVKKLFPFLAS